MNEREALRLALEALEYNDHLRGEAITAIKLSLEQERALQALHDENERLGLYKDAYGQPEPEPVAWTDIDFTNIYISKLVAKEKNANVPLYTSEPKREWQGLTDKEIDAIYESHHNQYGECETPNFGYERAIEAKLKEKNT